MKKIITVALLLALICVPASAQDNFVGISSGPTHNDNNGGMGEEHTEDCLRIVQSSRSEGKDPDFYEEDETSEVRGQSR